MKTSYSPDQLNDPFLAEAESIMRKCVHCGLCTATCPTYVALGDERASPRGRVYLINKMLEAGKRPTTMTVNYLDNCLTCLSCMTTCPSDVDYMHLIDMARAYANKRVQRPLSVRMKRSFLARTLPYPGRMKPLIVLGRLFRPLSSPLKKAGFLSLAAMLQSIPPALGGKARYAQRNPAQGRQMRRIAMIPGCANDLLRSRINDASVALLTRMGVEVIVPAGLGCCGAIEHHLGEKARAVRSARRNVDILAKLHAKTPFDAIITTAAGCGTQVKDYGRLLRDEPGHAARAEDIAKLSKDITEVLPYIIREAPRQWGDIRVAYHAACSLEHGQKVTEAPRRLLEQAGFIVEEIPEGHLCCGSPGSYSLLQPQIAEALRIRKLDNIDRVQPDVVAAGNIGCINHMSKESEAPIVHTIELLNWAYGGACPKELRHLQKCANQIDGTLKDSLLENVRQPVRKR